MFYFKTYGREYQFTLESDGLIHCKDLGLKAGTADELKPLVTAAVKKEKSAPRIPVIILGDRWGYFKEHEFGSASSTTDRHGYRWVSYDNGRNERKQRRTFGPDALVLDTPRNREIVSIMQGLGNRIEELFEQQKEWRSQLQKIGEEIEVENV